MIRIVLFEDNIDLSQNLTEVIGRTDDLRIVGSYGDARDASRKALLLRPDVILMDIEMPYANGLEGLREIRRKDENVCVLMFTVFDDDENVFQAICDGATGYLLKDTAPDVLLDGIRAAANGGSPITPVVARKMLRSFSSSFKPKRDLKELTSREHDVLSFMVRGHTYGVIAVQLGISEETVRSHVKNIFAKLQVNSKAGAVAKAIQRGLH